MKLKGKLILSCAALAAVATTAFSTTYAWYTSNTEVAAKGIQASTAAADSSTLQISTDGNSDWGTTVDLTTLLASAKSLTPVARTAGNAGVASTFKIQNDNAAPTTDGNATIDPVSDTAAVAGTNYVQFNLYFRNVSIADGANCPVYIKDAKIVNSNAGGVAAKLLTDIGSYKSTEHSSYKVDLLRALQLEIAASYTAAVGADAIVECTDDTATTGEKTSLYKLESYACKNAAGTAVKDTLSDLAADSWDALNYYNTVKGGTATRPAAANYVLPTTDLSSVIDKDTSMLGTIKSNKQILKTTWILYLDGWDKECFDACKGQTISLEFKFTTTPTTTTNSGSGSGSGNGGN